MDDFDRSAFQIKADSLVHRGKLTQESKGQPRGGSGGGTAIQMITNRPMFFEDRTAAKLGLVGLQSDRNGFWQRNWDPSGWAQLKSDGVSWWRFTHYGMWRAENQALRDGLVNNTDFLEHDVVHIRRSSTSTGKAVMVLEGRSYILPENSPIRVNIPVSFGSLVIPTSVDYASNISAGVFQEDINIWDFGGVAQPAVTAWGGWNISTVSASVARVSIFKCTTSAAPGSALVFAVPVTYGAYVLPAMTTLTVRAAASLTNEATQVAIGVFDVRTGGTLTTVSARSTRLRTLHNNFYRNNVSQVRYPLENCVSIMNTILASGLKVWWGGNHSPVWDTVEQFGVSVVSQIEEQMYAWMAQQNWPVDSVVIALEAEAVVDYEINSDVSVRQARWNKYRDQQLLWRLETARQYLPNHTLSYHYPNFPVGWGLDYVTEPLRGDTNVYIDAHIYANTDGANLSPLSTPGAYSTLWGQMATIQTRGMRFAVAEHGIIGVTSTQRLERAGYAITQARQYNAPIAFWVSDSTAHTSGLFYETTTGGFIAVRLFPALKALI